MLRDLKRLGTSSITGVTRAVLLLLFGIAALTLTGIQSPNLAMSAEKAAGTEFFGTHENATSIAYVLDRSGSMATKSALDMAKRELTKSINQLPEEARFAVIFYNLDSAMLTDADGNKGLMPVTKASKTTVGNQLMKITADGGTDHMIALRDALALHPEAIFFLTDAQLMTESDVKRLVKESGSTRIQVVQFGRGEEPKADHPLRKLATLTKGTYQYVDVNKFPAL